MQPKSELRKPRMHAEYLSIPENRPRINPINEKLKFVFNDVLQYFYSTKLVSLPLKRK